MLRLFGKFSPALTEWLLERVPIAPYCYLVQSYEDKDVVVCHRGSDALPAFDRDTEAEHTRRYWSSAHADNSFERMTILCRPCRE
jgi:hypothetical protein